MLCMKDCIKIRRKILVENENRNQVAKELRVSWDTVNRIANMSEEELDKRELKKDRGIQRHKTVITQEVEDKIKSMLNEEKDLPKKQRYTSKYIFNYLSGMGIYNGSAKRIRTVVAKYRRELKEAKKGKCYLPLYHELGDSFQIDHGEITIELAGQPALCYLFVASIPGSGGLKYAQCYLCKDQSAWGDFHERSMKYYGGVPRKKIVYDNDSVLIHKKQQTRFCVDLQIHYKFKARFCNKAAGYEKGSVENGVGTVRRNYLAGMPKVNTIEELNEHLESSMAKDLETAVHYETKGPLKDILAKLRGGLLNDFHAGREWGKWVDVKVDSCQMVNYKNKSYSVPEEYLGSILRLKATAEMIYIYKGDELVAKHKRIFFTNCSMELVHYMQQLLRKPRAIEDALVMHKTKIGKLLLKILERLKSRYEERDAIKEIKEIIELGLEYTEEEYLSGIELALEYGTFTAVGIGSVLTQLKTDQSAPELERAESETKIEYNLEQYGELYDREIIS